MKYIRLSLLAALVLCLLLGLSFPAFAAAEGSCGPYATWHFENSTLTLSGKGPVTDLGWYEFHDRILKVVVEPGIISLPSNAFQDCESLTDVILPEGLIHIGGFAFYNCKNLGAVQLPSTLTFIGECAFRNSGIVGITIPGGVAHIPLSTFDSCRKLLRVTLEEGVTSIGTSAFYGCEKLTDISLPESLETLENGAFENCTALRSIVLPQNLTVIPAHGFRGCKNLESVSLPPNTAIIGFEAFYDCPSLRSISIPATVRSISGLPNTLHQIHICDLSAWCQIDFSNSYQSCLEHAGLYLNGELITDLQIPSDCERIHSMAFYGYTQLKSVTIAEGVTGIGHSAFNGCTSLESIVLPKSIGAIGAYAFSDCHNLTKVTYLGGIDDLQKIHVYERNDNLLNASWVFGPFGTLKVLLSALLVTMLAGCLICGGILVACLVIYIRQRKYPFL